MTIIISDRTKKISRFLHFLHRSLFICNFSSNRVFYFLFNFILILIYNIFWFKKMTIKFKTININWNIYDWTRTYLIVCTTRVWNNLHQVQTQWENSTAQEGSAVPYSTSDNHCVTESKSGKSSSWSKSVEMILWKGK